MSRLLTNPTVAVLYICLVPATWYRSHYSHIMAAEIRAYKRNACNLRRAPANIRTRRRMTIRQLSCL